MSDMDLSNTDLAYLPQSIGMMTRLKRLHLNSCASRTIARWHLRIVLP